MELTIIPSRFPSYLHAKWSFTEAGRHEKRTFYQIVPIFCPAGEAREVERMQKVPGKEMEREVMKKVGSFPHFIQAPPAANDSRIHLPLQIISKIFNQGIGGSFDSHLYSRLVDPRNQWPTFNPTSRCFRRWNFQSLQNLILHQCLRAKCCRSRTGVLFFMHIKLHAENLFL